MNYKKLENTSDQQYRVLDLRDSSMFIAFLSIEPDTIDSLDI